MMSVREYVCGVVEASVKVLPKLLEDLAAFKAIQTCGAVEGGR